MSTEPRPQGSGTFCKGMRNPRVPRTHTCATLRAAMRNPFLETAGPVPDEELALRAQSGDRDALYQLFTFHQPWIFNIAIRMLGRHADAEVATQGILVEALNSLHAFDSYGRFGVWLY